MRTMLKYWCMLFGLGMSWIGCQDQESFVRQYYVDGHPVTVFDVPEMQKDKEFLNLTELAHPLRIVPLETNSQVLVAGDADYYIGDSCILVLQSDKVLLFDREGHFRRVVAKSGRGPEEYQRIGSFTVDEENNLLFLLEYSDACIKSYSLCDSTYFKQIKTIEDYNSTIACLENGNLLLVPYPWKEGNYLYYEQNQEGELQDYKQSYAANEIMYFGKTPLLYEVNGTFHYIVLEKEDHGCDTIYHITNKLIPKWIFSNTQKQYYHWKGETECYLFFDINFVSKREKIIYQGQETEAVSTDKQQFCYDKLEKSLKAGGILDDFLTNSTIEYKVQNGNRIYIIYPASVLARIRNSDRFPGLKEKLPAWKDMPDNLPEDANPVVVIGDL